MLESLRIATARGQCLLLYNFEVGNPVMEWREGEIPPALDYALAHPCQPGRYHGIGIHAYDIGYGLNDSWRNNRYVRMFSAIDLKYRALPVYFTEWGGSFIEEKEPVDCNTVLADLRWARNQYRDGIIDGVLIWSFGESQVWRDLTECGPAIETFLRS